MTWSYSNSKTKCWCPEEQSNAKACVNFVFFVRSRCFHSNSFQLAGPIIILSQVPPLHLLINQGSQSCLSLWLNCGQSQCFHSWTDALKISGRRFSIWRSMVIHTGYKVTRAIRLRMKSFTMSGLFHFAAKKVICHTLFIAFLWTGRSFIIFIPLLSNRSKVWVWHVDGIPMR